MVLQDGRLHFTASSRWGSREKGVGQSDARMKNIAVFQQRKVLHSITIYNAMSAFHWCLSSCWQDSCSSSSHHIQIPAVPAKRKLIPLSRCQTLSHVISKLVTGFRQCQAQGWEGLRVRWTELSQKPLQPCPSHSMHGSLCAALRCKHHSSVCCSRRQGRDAWLFLKGREHHTCSWLLPGSVAMVVKVQPFVFATPTLRLF